MLRALTLAIADLADGRIIAILLRSLVVTVLIFVGVAVLLGWALDGVDPCRWWSGADTCPLDASASGLGALLLTAIALWLLFPAVALGVISAYMDQIIAAVEARHYPTALASARPLGIIGGAALGLRSSLRVIVYNLLALPFYIVLLVTGVGTVLLFVAVNGIAIGRDLGEMVAARHGDGASRGTWLRATRVERGLMGAIVAGVFLVPLVNLLAPVFGAAMATHLFHGASRQAADSGNER
jgi:uncharacterized protein involved in cysteine biosynthesis